MEVPVLVAGAGTVGLSLASELERHGIRHRVVDTAPERAAVSRATDLHARSLELWDHTGVADAVLAAAVPLTGVPLLRRSSRRSRPATSSPSRTATARSSAATGQQGALGVLPRERVPDAGPLIRRDGSPTSLRALSCRLPSSSSGSAPVPDRRSRPWRWPSASRRRCGQRFS